MHERQIFFKFFVDISVLHCRNFDLDLSISSPEEDNAKSESLAFKSARERYMDLGMLEEKYRLEKELQRVKNEGKSK